ncbi:MAG: metallophosphoesterase [Burkholderiales bacterium]|nr:metallophosphoesterase [Burkholderiales bacterium]
MKRRIFAISDLHLDYAVNQQWLEGLSLVDFQDDVLILAGDISDAPKLQDLCFREVARRFHRVLFVPGNHDIWIKRYPCEGGSLAKFALVQALAQQHGVLTTPWHEGCLSIVPLLSWYDFSFGEPSERLREAWMDFFACEWPAGWGETEISQHFLGRNAELLALKNETVISFSHFMPRLDILPQEMTRTRHLVLPVLGSTALDRQIQQLQSAIHVYGHSHLNRHIERDGRTYINNAFAYPAESHIAAKQLRCIFEM